MPKEPKSEILVPLRIILVAPPPGVDFGIQEGKGNDYKTIAVLGYDRLGGGKAKAIVAGHDSWNRQRWRAKLCYSKANRWMEGSEITLDAASSS